MKKYLLVLALLAGTPGLAQAVTPTVTVTLTFTAPTLNADGSAITGAVTYNVYASVQGGTLAKVATGLTANPASYVTPLTAIPYGTTECFALTTVANGLESGPSSPVTCKTFTAPTPNAPTNVAVTIVGTPVSQ